MWSKLVSLFHSLMLTYPVTFISSRGASLADIHITSSSSFSNLSSLLPSSGSTGWARVRWPPRNEGRSGKCLTIILSRITTWRKITGAHAWLIVWSLPQGPPGTSGYPGTMGPPGLPVSHYPYFIMKEQHDWHPPDSLGGGGGVYRCVSQH